MQARHAGTPCEEQEDRREQSFVAAMKLAEDTRSRARTVGRQVALITRVGQDLSRYGQRYSHMAYVWRDHPKGRWTVVHELNQCGTAQLGAVRPGTGQFLPRRSVCV
jgi:hypothetical protein